MRITLPEVLAATCGILVAGPSTAGAATYHTDSRELEPGGLFFALRGAARDGHDFCAEAAARGAAILVVERELKEDDISPPPHPTKSAPHHRDFAGTPGPAVAGHLPSEGRGAGPAVVRVADTWRALYDLAAHVLELVSPLVVGITGSNGKTSTK